MTARSVLKPSLVAALVIVIAMNFVATTANSQSTTVGGTFTGTPFGNTGFVLLTADVNLDAFAFDLAGSGGYAHNWWYAPGGFSSLMATVTGSTTVEFNGVFSTDAFAWLRIYSNSDTPEEALMDGASFADLGTNYTVPNAPSDAGVGELQLGVVSDHPGEHVASAGIFAVVPEPTTFSLLALTGLLLVALRVGHDRRARRRSEFQL
jgi:hypothetical protein